MEKKFNTTEIVRLAGQVVANGNLEILTSHINSLEEKIERRRDQLKNMDQRFEFFNELEVRMWEIELDLLKGKIKTVPNH